MLSQALLQSQSMKRLEEPPGAAADANGISKQADLPSKNYQHQLSSICVFPHQTDPV